MTIANFEASDVLLFDSGLDIHYELRTDHYPRLGLADPGLVLDKPYQYGFLMDLAPLGLGLVSGSIYLAGTLDAATRMIRWQVYGEHDNIPAGQSPVGRAVFTSDIVTSVDGQLLTRIDDIMPMFESSSHFIGARLFRTSMTFMGSDNVIRFWDSRSDAEPEVVMEIPEGTVAFCGEPVPAFTFEVNIHCDSFRGNACGERVLISDAIAGFTASISNPHSFGRLRSSEVTYEWQFSYRDTNGMLMPESRSEPSTDRHIAFTPPRPGVLQVTVTAHATTDSTNPVESASYSETRQYTVEDEEIFLLSSALCTFRRNVAGLNAIIALGFGESKTIGGIRIIDPLWDPTPDYWKARTARKPYTLQQLQQLNRNMERTAKYAADIVTKTAKLIEVKQKEAAKLKKELKQPKPVM